MFEGNDGGPAFPCDGLNMTTGERHSGMMLRDYFAAKAMASLLLLGANQPTPQPGVNNTMFDDPSQPWYFGDWEDPSNDGRGVNNLAADAYYVADAMLKAREAT